MIQRIQTIYLLLVVLITVAVLKFISLWSIATTTKVIALDLFSSDVLMLKIIPVLFIGVVILALISILFTNRKLQFVLNRLNILINLFLLGLLLYVLLSLSGEMKISEKGIGVFVPLLAILLLVLANKAIKRDEDLVKSVDRLR